MLSTIAVFDLDDTLIDRAAAWRQWCERFLRRHDFASDEDDLNWMSSIDRSGRAERSDVLAALRDRNELPYSVEEEMRLYRRDFPRLQRCRPGTVDALTRLRDEGWRVALVTNGPATQHEKVDAAGLRDHLDAIVISGVDEVRKPSPAIYALAADRCGGTVGDIEWVVGDDPQTDILGAERIGAKSVWIRNQREWPQSDFDFAPTSQVDDISEAVDVILRGDP